ncbi:MAG: hypothetical protein D3913_09550 [Candidatus Electrothrix sp. LOE1_4_5]|nr:hypothetical protein [Candidatus Electrothrix gigas]
MEVPHSVSACTKTVPELCRKGAGRVPEGWLLQPYFHLLFPVLSPLRRNKNFNLFILFWVKNTRPSSPVLSVFS